MWTALKSLGCTEIGLCVETDYDGGFLRVQTDADALFDTAFAKQAIADAFGCEWRDLRIGPFERNENRAIARLWLDSHALAICCGRWAGTRAAG